MFALKSVPLIPCKQNCDAAFMYTWKVPLYLFKVW